MVVEKVRAESNPTFGFNAETGNCRDLITAGVIDPTKVCRTAIQNASPIAALMLTTGAMVCEIREKKNPRPPQAATASIWIIELRQRPNRPGAACSEAYQQVQPPFHLF